MIKAVNESPDVITPPVLTGIKWVSPLADDDYSEYRDALFLDKVELSHLTGDLLDYWPRGGPQWDGLAVGGNKVVLAEAKAHLREFRSPGCGAKNPSSLAQIRKALDETKASMGVPAEANWFDQYYQYTNRLAFLHFLRHRGVDAHLLFINFLGDTEMNGPTLHTEWEDEIALAKSYLEIPSHHGYSPYIHYVYPRVADLM